MQQRVSKCSPNFIFQLVISVSPSVFFLKDEGGDVVLNQSMNSINKRVTALRFCMAVAFIVHN